MSAVKPDWFELSGFESEAAYDRREPDWDGEDEYASSGAAIQAAAHWLVGRGDHAVVEVIQMHRRQGTVTDIVTSAGDESVSAAD